LVAPPNKLLLENHSNWTERLPTQALKAAAVRRKKRQQKEIVGEAANQVNPTFWYISQQGLVQLERN